MPPPLFAAWFEHAESEVAVADGLAAPIVQEVNVVAPATNKAPPQPVVVPEPPVGALHPLISVPVRVSVPLLYIPPPPSARVQALIVKPCVDFSVAPLETKKPPFVPFVTLELSIVSVPAAT